MWVLCYPLHFVARRRRGGRNLILPALLATAALMSPWIVYRLGAASLPRVDSADVTETLVQIVRDTPEYRANPAAYGRVAVEDAREVWADPDGHSRRGRATLVTNFGREAIYYTVTWDDRRKGTYYVTVVPDPDAPPPALPSPTAPEVVEVVARLVRESPEAAARREEVGEITVTDPVELKADPAKTERRGRAKIRCKLPPENVYYVVTWRDRAAGVWQVAITDPPPGANEPL